MSNHDSYSDSASRPASFPKLKRGIIHDRQKAYPSCRFRGRTYSLPDNPSDDSLCPSPGRNWVRLALLTSPPFRLDAARHSLMPWVSGVQTGRVVR